MKHDIFKEFPQFTARFYVFVNFIIQFRHKTCHWLIAMLLVLVQVEKPQKTCKITSNYINTTLINCLRCVAWQALNSAFFYFSFYLGRRQQSPARPITISYTRLDLHWNARKVFPPWIISIHTLLDHQLAGSSGRHKQNLALPIA